MFLQEKKNVAYWGSLFWSNLAEVLSETFKNSLNYENVLCNIKFPIISTF